jgi:hypothetical protein
VKERERGGSRARERKEKKRGKKEDVGEEKKTTVAYSILLSDVAN